MREKRCYVCGRKIKEKEPCYNIGGNSYVCTDTNCYQRYHWDSYAAEAVVDKGWKHAIIDGRAYYIGDEKDNPQGFGGQHFDIQFYMGPKISTNSLWCIGEVPESYRNVLKDNAYII